MKEKKLLLKKKKILVISFALFSFIILFSFLMYNMMNPTKLNRLYASVITGNEPANPSFKDTDFYYEVVEQYNKLTGQNLTYTTNLTDEQLEKITILYINNKNIEDLSGLEKLTNLKTLNANENNLTTIDISSNTKLTFLSLNNNKITYINLKNNFEIKSLYLMNNRIESIDINNLNNLNNLYISNNNLSELDVNNNLLLNDLDIENNNLSTLDVSKLENLKSLYAANNYIEHLNLGEIQNLKALQIYNNKISELNIRKLFLLEKLIAGNNKLNDIYLGNNTRLTYLDLHANNLSSLSSLNSIYLKNILVYNNNLDYLNLNKMSELENLDATSNNISNIYLPSTDTLTNFRISFNKLENIDLRGVSKLENLAISKNLLTNIDLSNNKELKSLNAFSNKLSSIILPNNGALESVNIKENSLYELDINNNINLTELIANDNRLESININGLTQLSKINLSNNVINSIDFKSNINLKEINLYNNRLRTIDLTQNINLETLVINKNMINNIDLTKNIKLKSLNISDNNLSNIDLSYNTSLTNYVLGENNYFDGYQVGDSVKKDDIIKLPNNNITYYINDENIIKIEGDYVNFLDYGYTNLYIKYDCPDGSKHSFSSTINLLGKLESSKYEIDYENKIIYVGTDDNSTILSNISYNFISENDKTSLMFLYIRKGQIQLKSYSDSIIYDTYYILGSINSSEYEIDGDFIYTGTKKFDINKIDAGNYVLDFSKSTLRVKNNNTIIKEYKILSILSEKYEFQEKDDYLQVYVGKDENYLDNIEILNMTYLENNGILELFDENNVLRTKLKVVNLDIEFEVTEEVIYTGEELLLESDLDISFGTASLNNNTVSIIDDEGDLIKTYDVVRIESDYDISSGYIYFGIQNPNLLVEKTRFVSGANNSSIIINDENIMQIKHNNDILQEIKVGTISSNVYDLSNKYIYDLNFNPRNIIDKNVSLTLDEYNTLRIEYQNNLMQSFDIVSFSSTKYNLSNDFIYLKNEELNLNNFNLNNCVVKEEKDKISFIYDSNEIKSIPIVRVSSKLYDLSKDYLFLGVDDIDVKKINISNATLEEKNNILNVIYNNKIIDQFNLIKLISNIYDLSKDTVNIKKDFKLDDIKVTNANMLYDSSNNELLVLYNNSIVKKYILKGNTSVLKNIITTKSTNKSATNDKSNNTITNRKDQNNYDKDIITSSKNDKINENITRINEKKSINKNLFFIPIIVVIILCTFIVIYKFLKNN